MPYYTRSSKSTKKDTSKDPAWKEELLTGFSALLQKNRQDLSHEADLVLSKHEDELQRRLESLPKSLGRAVDASRPSSCSFGDPGHAKVLGHALKKLKRSHRSHKKDLKRLWKDWHKTQRDIANLGSEVLGASRIVVVQDGTSRRQSSRKKKEPRAVTHQSREIKQNEKVEFDSLLSNEVAKIRDMSRKAIAKARSRAKASRVEKQRSWETVGDLARKLIPKGLHLND